MASRISAPAAGYPREPRPVWVPLVGVPEAVGDGAPQKSGAEDETCHTSGLTRVVVCDACSTRHDIIGAYGVPPEAAVLVVQVREQEDY